jgi:hypothetical protein
LRDNAIAAASFSLLWNVPSIPHGDTLEDLARRLDPEQVQESIGRAVETLIRKKALHRQRLLDCYYVVAIDGTGMLSFEKRHCPHCLTQTQDGVTRYYHPVLEAKLVTPAGLVVSLMTEFIENVDPGASKQDCELKAFYRLAARLKQRFPRLPISLCADCAGASAGASCSCSKRESPFSAASLRPSSRSSPRTVSAVDPTGKSVKTFAGSTISTTRTMRNENIACMS